MSIEYSDRKNAKGNRFREYKLISFLKKDKVFAWLLVIPTLIAVLAVIGFPWFYSIWMSLNEIDLYSDTTTFVGLRNYFDIFGDSTFLISLRNTAVFSIAAVLLVMVLGMGMALILNESFKGRGLVRALALIPWSIAMVGNAVLWLFIFNGEFGVLNSILNQLGVIDEYINVLRSPSSAMGSVIIVYIWRQAPLTGLLLLAGLQGVPENLYAASKVDGANAFQRFFRITLPSIRPIMLITLVLSTINAIMQFDLFYVMTQGGPGYATTVVPFHGYRVTFNYLRFGEGTAVLYTLSLICLILAIIYIRIFSRSESTRKSRDVAVELATTASPGLTPLNIHAEKPDFQSKKYIIKPNTVKKLRRAFIGLFALLLVVWTLLPIYWLINCSLSNMDELIVRPPRSFPIPPRLEHFQVVLSGFLGETPTGAEAEYFGSAPALKRFIPSLMNSILISLGVTAICLILGSLSGWAYARYKERSFTLKTSLMVLLVTRMIPGLTLTVPIFMLFQRLDLIDKKLGLILAYTSFGLPLMVWILKGYFEGIPDNLEKAALVDGATRLGSLLGVVLPVARPGLAAGGIFTFIVAFNEFGIALILSKSLASKTMTVALSSIVSEIQAEVGNFFAYPALLASTVLAVSVTVILALVFQRHLVQGMLAGSIKG